MAQIATGDNTSIYQLKKWLGLNEAPDGDTGLKMGEAAAMRNFRITREGHLQIRPGYAAMCTLCADTPVQGMWSGYVNGAFHFLAACGGKVWDIDLEGRTGKEIGEIEDAPTHFFGFEQKVYLLNGIEYYSWSGEGTVTRVEGYVPLVVTASPPEGGGTVLERVNLLTDKRRVRFSPDGNANTFRLPEDDVTEVVSVECADPVMEWTLDTKSNSVALNPAPSEGLNTLTVTYRKENENRARVLNMRFSELYNGQTDARVFLYGDETNEAIYSDLDENGKPSAEYFPDLNVMAVGSKNTPITALIRHYDRLLVYKTDGAYSVSHSTMALEDGIATAAFYVSPLNGEIGNIPCGQVRLVQNDPRTLHGQAVYEWVLSGSGTRDERNAKRISDRVERTLSGFDLAECIVFDDERRQEYYLICGDKALIHNYGNDAWYYYDHFPATCMDVVDGEVYFGTPDGRVMHLSRKYRNDDLESIDAYWESGSMDFDADWRRKYSANIWVAIKPESQGRITVTAQSNRKSDYMRKVVASGLATFAHASFAHWSFGTNRKPQVERVRLKVKKFAFYKLILSSCSASATATVLGADFQIRYTGNVK